MTMGQRIYQARMEAGLSQRQLAGEEITRNMLSSLEHDAANPSVATLTYLAQRLGKPVSYFLGEDAPQIPEYAQLQAARASYDAGAYRKCLDALGKIQEPGEILGREISLLRALAAMALAEEMIGKGRLPYAGRLLAQAERAGEDCPYFDGAQLRRLRILQAMQAPGRADRIPAEDDALLLRAQGALDNGQPGEAERYLNACQDRKGEQWNYLMGMAHFHRGAYAQAAEHLHRAEDQRDVRQELEICYRELGNFQKAYYYAKKQ